MWCNVTKIKFTDGSDWLDTENSKYLSIKNGEVRFLTIKSPSPEDTGLKIGDSVILLDTSNLETPLFIEKIVESIENLQEFFGGWEITVEREHLFLTRIVNWARKLAKSSVMCWVLTWGESERGGREVNP
jgi:hypothetical protein